MPILPPVWQSLASPFCVWERETLLGCPGNGGKFIEVKDVCSWSFSLNSASDWDRGQVSSVVAQCWGAGLVCMADWTIGQLLYLLPPYLSLIMTYPGRVCLANSFLFSSRSSGTRRKFGGLLQPVVRVPQSLLPVHLRTPANINRNARWRSLPS